MNNCSQGSTLNKASQKGHEAEMGHSRETVPSPKPSACVEQREAGSADGGLSVALAPMAGVSDLWADGVLVWMVTLSFSVV